MRSQKPVYSQQEIAELVSVSRQAINKRAANGRPKKGERPWPVAERKPVRGGEAIFHAFDDLPKDLQKKLVNAEESARLTAEIVALEERKAREAQEAAEEMAETEADKRLRSEKERLQRIADGRAKFSALPKKSRKRQRAEARYWIVRAAAHHMRETGLTKRQAHGDFANQVNRGDITPPAWIMEHINHRAGRPSLSEGSIRRWDWQMHNGGIWALTDGYGTRAGQSKIFTNQRLYKVVLGAMVKYPQIKAKRIKEFLEAEYPDLNIVSLRRIQAFMSSWKKEHAQLWTYITNPDRWKNVYMSGFGDQDEHIVRINQLWELDSTPGDWGLIDGRHTVVGAIDLYSKRTKYFVSKTSTAAAVKQLTRRCILDWGVPEGVKTDNGKDYLADEFTGLLRDLEINQYVCLPFASEEKASIERAFQTMSHGLLELLPGFCGHNVAEKKEIEARKAFAKRVMEGGEIEVQLTAAELQEKLDQWADHVYAHNQHSGLNGKTPWQMANESQHEIRQISNVHALDELLAPVAGTRVVGKKGIQFDTRYYRDLNGEMGLMEGKQVELRYDEQDIGRLAVYADGRFLCWAVCPEVEGISKQEMAAAIKRRQKQLVAEQAREIKAFGKEIKKDIPQAVLEHRIAQSQNIEAVQFRATEYSTDRLEQAGLAAGRGRQPERQVSEKDREMEAQFKQEFEQETRLAPVTPIRQDTPEQRFRRWLGIDEKLKSGASVPTEDERFHRLYPESAECKAMKDFYEDFGQIKGA